MLKEIHEQTQAVQDTFAGRVDFERGEILLDTFKLTRDELRSIQRLHLLACGTSWHAALIGKFMIEEIARLPVEVDYGSEYRYRNPIVSDNVLAVGISQSGETADTLSSMEAARERGARLACVCNVPGSQATRVSDGVIYTHAGPEIGVASTKAFTTQLVALYLLALYLRQERNGPVERHYLDDLARLPQAVDEVIRRQEGPMEEMARRYFRADDFLYPGRGINYPIALEGALKLKEISYIHAEAYPAGELKHGPLALVTAAMPVVTVAPNDALLEKLKSNMQEVRARGGVLYVLADADTRIASSEGIHVIRMPEHYGALSPLLHVVPLQMLAYHTALAKGTDVDKPRNLAKSVTVE
jgi:glucosamine--fructose-6-phosphate aminotransferase (isomerizing)